MGMYFGKSKGRKGEVKGEYNQMNCIYKWNQENINGLTKIVSSNFNKSVTWTKIVFWKSLFIKKIK